jgi:hypothetical protein
VVTDANPKTPMTITAINVINRRVVMPAPRCARSLGHHPSYRPS